MFKKTLAATVALIALSACQTTLVSTNTGLNLCSDYEDSTSCWGGNRYRRHTGIDFGGSVGTKVISSTYGEVFYTGYSRCSGGYAIIKTDIKKGITPLYARYLHVKPQVQAGQRVRPGDVIASVGPLMGTSCLSFRNIPHVHFELGITKWKNDVNPHKYWTNGPNNVTCFRKGMRVPKGKMVAPIQC